MSTAGFRRSKLLLFSGGSRSIRTGRKSRHPAGRRLFPPRLPDERSDVVCIGAAGKLLGCRRSRRHRGSGGKPAQSASPMLRRQSDRQRLRQATGTDARQAERTVTALWNRVGAGVDVFANADCTVCFKTAGHDQINQDGPGRRIWASRCSTGSIPTCSPEREEASGVSLSGHLLAPQSAPRRSAFTPRFPQRTFRFSRRSRPCRCPGSRRDRSLRATGSWRPARRCRSGSGDRSTAAGHGPRATG